MKIKNILYVFLFINIMMITNIHAMEQPDKQKQTGQPLRRIYPSNLPFLLLYGWKCDESCLSNLPKELIVEIINHTRNLQRGIQNGQYLLNAARANDKREVSRLLTQPYIDVNVKDEDGNTALIWAVKCISKAWTPSYGNPEIVQMLLDKGANLGIQDNDGWTALHWAVRKNNPEIVQILLDNGANPNIQDNYGYTPLIRPAINNKQEIVQILLNKGANPDIQDDDGWTPLHCAAKYNNLEIVQLLLNVKANPDIPDRDGWTPLNWAVRNKNLKIIKILLNYGADECTALNLAWCLNDQKIINLLMANERKYNAAYDVGTSGS